jgi:Cft2 family RNA processing exonuclease
VHARDGALHAARRGVRETLTLDYDVPARIGDATVTLLPAGHALGSAMLVAESARGRVAYTGDYKLRPNPFSPPARIPRVDTLVMECTFGEPRYVFPPEHELLAGCRRSSRARARRARRRWCWRTRWARGRRRSGT